MTFNHSKHIFNILQRRFLIYITIIVIGVASIFALSFYASSTLKKNTSVIDVLAKQRMLTQTISKNASRYSVIHDVLLDDRGIQNNDILLAKLNELEGLIVDDAKAYEITNLNLSRGFVIVNENPVTISNRNLTGVQDILREIQRIWIPFNSAALDLISNPYNSTKFKESLIYINENNDNLMRLSNQILVKFQENITNQNKAFTNIILMLIVFVAITTSYLMYLMYSDFFKALKIFYTEFDKLGLEHEHPSDVYGSTVAREIQSMLSGFNETLELTEKINSSDSFSDSLEYIYNSFSHFLPYTYIGIALLKDDKPTRVVASYGISSDKHIGLSDEIVGYEALLSDTSLEQIMMLKEPRVINDLDEYFKTRPIKPYSRLIMNYGIKSSITLPLDANETPIGFIFFSSDQKNVYKRKHIEYLKIISNSIALSFQKNIFVDDLVYSSVLALAKLSEARDEDTGDHLIRMSQYAGALAQQLKTLPKYKDILTKKYIDELVKFSPMHDIGKVGIPDAILLKPGKLTPEEFEIMKTHTQYGANVLTEAENNVKRKGRSLFSTGIEIAQNHHEKFDGSGYPRGLKGDEIPLSARIITVADVFDALLSKRPYKEPFTPELTHKIINEGRGKHFDPDIVDAFNDIFQELLEIKERFK